MNEREKLVLTHIQIETLLNAIRDISHSDGKWKEKKKEIEDLAHQHDDWQTALEDFLSWFEEPYR